MKNASLIASKSTVPIATAYSHTPQTFDIWLLWVTVRRCWHWAIPSGLLLAAVAGFIVYQTFVPVYVASHILEVNVDFVAFKGVMPVTVAMARSERFYLTHAMVIDPVLQDAKVITAASLRSTKDREYAIRRNVSISENGTPNLLTISYCDTNPNDAAMVCNAIAQSYVKLKNSFDSGRVAKMEGLLNTELDYWRDQDKKYRERIRSTGIQMNGYDPNNKFAQMEFDLAYYVSLKNEVTECISSETMLKAEIEADEAEFTSETGDGTSHKRIGRKLIVDQAYADPTVVDLRGRIEAHRARMLNMEGLRTDKLRKDDYQLFARETKEFESKLETALEAAMKAAEKDLFEKGLENKRFQLAEMERRRATLENSQKIERKRLETEKGTSIDLFFLDEERRQAVQVRDILTARITALRTERKRGDALETWAPALPPTKPIEQIPYKKVFMASGAAFVVPFLIGFLWEMKTKRITSPENVETHKLPPVIGEIARVPFGSRGGRNHRVFEESIESLRANIMLSRGLNDVRSIAVASSMSGEGKSSLASQLAISLAKATDKQVLLIDADLRSPDQHSLFGLELGPGLAAVLADEVTLHDAIDRSLGNLVHILPAGVMSSSPHRLLNQSAIRSILDEAYQEYQYVIIDTAPVLAAGETLVVASEVDATLICIMRDLSKKDNVNRCLRRLEAAGARVVGTVFSGVSATQYAYRYGDYKYMSNSNVRS